jgi:hypothetical protein
MHSSPSFIFTSVISCSMISVFIRFRESSEKVDRRLEKPVPVQLESKEVKKKRISSRKCNALV